MKWGVVVSQGDTLEGLTGDRVKIRPMNWAERLGVIKAID